MGLISKTDYAGDVESAVSVLEGRNDDVARDLGARMEAAAEMLEFERAAQLRDQLAALRKRSKLSVTGADAVAITDVPVQPAGLAILNTHNITDFGFVASTQTRR